MDDKTILEGILWDLKVLADLCLHGTIESSNEVNKIFKDTLSEVLTMQNNLFTLMNNEGMYKLSTVEKTKLTKTINKFNPTLENE